MNLRDLQYLVAVYDLQSFSRAAEQCFVSQPTLSGQLKKLEQGLGVVLIERSTRNLIFTPIGEKVVAHARAILSTVDDIKELAKQSDDPLAGDLHLGLIPTIGPFLLPLIVPALTKSFPKLHLYLYELKTGELIDKLLKGGLDAAILAKLDWDYPVNEIPLYREDFKLAINVSDPLASRNKAVSRSVLEDRSVLMLEDGHCLRDQALGVCFSAGAKEDKRFQATSVDTLLHMVASGAGMTLMPELATVRQLEGIRYLSFAAPIPHREVVMLTRKNSSRTSVLNAVAELISSTYKASSGSSNGA